MVYAKKKWKIQPKIAKNWKYDQSPVFRKIWIILLILNQKLDISDLVIL